MTCVIIIMLTMNERTYERYNIITNIMSNVV